MATALSDLALVSFGQIAQLRGLRLKVGQEDF